MTELSTPEMGRDELLALFQLSEREHSTVTILFHSAIASHFGQGLTDWICGEIIQRKGPLTAGQLAELTGLTTGAVTGLIDRLERAEMVQRSQNPQDRRQVIIQAMPEAEEKLTPFFDSIFAAFSEVIANYTDEELALIIDFEQRSAAMMEERALNLRSSGSF